MSDTKAPELVRCPRCGWHRYTPQDAPEPVIGAPYPALSLHENTLICSWCGDEETKIARAGAPPWDESAWMGRPVPATRRYRKRAS